MNLITGILNESLVLLNKMSPYLLFGFLFAGLMHLFIDTKTVASHLGHNSLLSVVKASLFGIPLPLCSCGVIPAAASLSKEGASKGAILSFLISTPTTGVDSILATYSLMGLFFSLYRVFAAFTAGVFSGIMANFFMKDTPLRPVREEDSCLCCDNHEPHKHSFFEQLMAAFRYAFIDLFEDVWKWLIAGMLIGGAISFFIPDDFIGSHIHYGFQGMILMLIIGLPMYVCATGSIPIAAALMMKGLNPGAAFVFLLVGPATNAVSMTVIGKSLGRKALIIYISSLVASSLVLGAFLDIIWQWFKVGEFKHLAFHGTFLPKGIEYVSTAIILILIVYILVSEFFKSRKETL